MCISDDYILRLRQLLRASLAPDINYNHRAFGSPLHFKAWCGTLDAADLLLTASVDSLAVSYSGEIGRATIGVAARKGHRDIVKRF